MSTFVKSGQQKKRSQKHYGNFSFRKGQKHIILEAKRRTNLSQTNPPVHTWACPIALPCDHFTTYSTRPITLYIELLNTFQRCGIEIGSYK